MIIGIGIDLTELLRIKKIYEKYGNTFLNKFLTEQEISFMPLNPVAYLAGRFAAKEAAVKALGTGYSNGISPRQIIIEKNMAGQPYMQFIGNAKVWSQNMGVSKVHLSITHEHHCACAVVILEK